jgi:hypothetical protein
VDLHYRADRALLDPDTPLRLAAGGPRFLPDASSPRTARLYAAGGWTASPWDEPAGWVLPAVAEGDEVWIVDGETPREILAVEPILSGTEDLPTEIDYLMIAPTPLLAGTERLATFHRGRGLRVAVVDVRAIYDAFGGGQKSPGAIRRFLDQRWELSSSLRYVLLVGDADWLRIDDRTPYGDAVQPRRDRLPGWTYLSDYGPAVSDHYYAMDPDDEAMPRFAIGRLPVLDTEELHRVVGKILRHAAAPRPTGPPTALMLSDRSSPSARRLGRLLQKLEEAPLELRRPEEDSPLEPDEQTLAALDQGPEMV